MRPDQRTALLAAAFAAIAFVSGCDSLPALPEIDLSGWFNGNHGKTSAASLDVVQHEPDLIFRVHNLSLKDFTVDPGANEITLHFNDNADPAVIADIQRSAPEWIAGAQAKEDAATIVANRDVEFSAVPEPEGFDLTLRPRAVASAKAVTSPVEPVETNLLRGDSSEADAGAEVDGLQREGLLDAFGAAPDTRGGL